MRTVVLEGDNILLGRSRFLSFNAPDDWRIFPLGVIDVEAYKVVEGVNWVISGYITLGAIVEGSEVLIRIKISNPYKKLDLNNFLKRRGKRKGMIEIGGHRGAYILKSTRKGLLKSRKLIELTICFYCDKTRRKIEIMIEAEREEDVLKAMDMMLTASCH